MVGLIQLIELVHVGGEGGPPPAGRGIRKIRKSIFHFFNPGTALAMAHGQKQCIRTNEALLYVIPSVLHALAWLFATIRGIREIIENYRIL